MARVVPSDIVKTADQMFQSYIQHPTSFPQVEAAALPSFAGFARLVEAVPEEYLELDSASYAALIASVAYLKALPNVFQASRVAIRLLLNGYDRNIALIRDAMALLSRSGPNAGDDCAALHHGPRTSREHSARHEHGTSSLGGGRV